MQITRQKMHNENWDDIRFVLAVAKTGTVSAAARELGVNHATVLRRVSSFEERYGAELFRKTPRGYEVPDSRKRVVDAVEDVEAAVRAVARVMRGRRSALSGLVRVTATDTFAQYVLPPVLAALRRAEKDLAVEVLTSNEHLDISRLRAEIAIRPALRLPDDLVGEEAGELEFRILASDGTDRWLGLTGPLERSVAGQWMIANVPDNAIGGSFDSFPTVAAMAARGEGCALLPSVFKSVYPTLQDISPRNFRLSVPVHVACHADLVDSSRLRAVRRAISHGLSAELGRFNAL